MKKGEYPWLPLYVSDWLSSPTVTMMPLAAQGGFARLLCCQWKTGFIPDDPVMIAKLLTATPEEFKTVWEWLAPVFPVVEEGLRQNARLEIERSKRQGRSKSAAESAGRRWAEAPKESKPKPQRKPKATNPENADTPFAKIERILGAVSNRLGGSEVQRADVVRQLRAESPINLLLAQFSEDEVVDLYCFAANNWNGGASWSAVHSQRDSIRAAMKRPAGAKRGKESASDKYERLKEGGE